MKTISPTILKRLLKIGVFSILLISFIAGCLLVIKPISRNLSFRKALIAAIRQPTDFDQAVSILSPITEEDCRVNWQLILLTYDRERAIDVENNITNLLACTQNSVEWLLLIYPNRTDIAAKAVQQYPNDPKAWFWLGDLAKETGNIELAKDYFNESIRLVPAYDLAWCRLGWINEGQGLISEAEGSFLRCCENGDPGSNGCYGAGRMAEKLNDIPSAIQYYRRSHWLPALQRADELEAGK